MFSAGDEVSTPFKLRESLLNVPMAPALELLCTYVEGISRRFRTRDELVAECKRLLTFVLETHGVIDFVGWEEIVRKKTDELLDNLRICERDEEMFDCLYQRAPRLEKARLIYYYRHRTNYSRGQCLIFTVNPARYYPQAAFFVDNPHLFRSVELQRLQHFTDKRHRFESTATVWNSPHVYQTLRLLTPNDIPSDDLRHFVEKEPAYTSPFLSDETFGFVLGSPDEAMVSSIGKINSKEPESALALSRNELVAWMRVRWGGSITRVFSNFECLYSLHAEKVVEKTSQQRIVTNGVTTVYPKHVKLTRNSLKSNWGLPLSLGEVPADESNEVVAFSDAGVRFGFGNRPPTVSLGHPDPKLHSQGDAKQQIATAINTAAKCLAEISSLLETLIA